MEYSATIKKYVLNNFQAINGENQSTEQYAQNNPMCD